ncbi:MAG: hypothetical protein O2800_05830 [Planctomycetota bacterium]|nr:hypothetical protein [Planctomycetota bacterium]
MSRSLARFWISIFATLAASPPLAASEAIVEWPRRWSNEQTRLTLSTPVVHEVVDGHITFQSVYEIGSTTVDPSQSTSLFGVVTLRGSAHREADGKTITLTNVRVAAMSAASLNPADAPRASELMSSWLRDSLGSMRVSDFLALTVESALPDAGSDSLTQRETKLLDSIPLNVAETAAGSPSSTPIATAALDAEDLYIGRGNWIHKLSSQEWIRFSPEHGWKKELDAQPLPVGTPTTNGESIESMRSRARTLLDAMRRAPRQLELARSRRTESVLRRTPPKVEP